MNKNLRSVLILVTILGISLILVFPVFAHPGRTDAHGCHTCRTNCASWGLSNGEYHCHRAKTLPQPVEPIKSHYDSDGTGWTEPAPEYKTPEPKQLESNLETESQTAEELDLNIEADSEIQEKTSNKPEQKQKKFITVFFANVFSAIKNFFSKIF